MSVAPVSETADQQPHPRRGLDSVEGVLAFHGETEGRPYLYTHEPPPGVPRTYGERDERTVRIRNGWKLADTTLDVHGFHAGSYPTNFTDWTNPTAIAHDYYPEVASYVLEVTGATRAVIFDHNVRRNSKAADSPWSEAGKYARTATWIHNDYTMHSAPKRAAELLGAEPTVRYAYVNLWRPIVGPLRDAPLAICDGRTIRMDDLELASLIYPDREGEIYLFRHAPRLEWYFFPEMSTDEALFLKCMDSALDGRTRFSAHTSFHDPSAPADAPPRESIETRALVLWE